MFRVLLNIYFKLYKVLNATKQLSSIVRPVNAGKHAAKPFMQVLDADILFPVLDASFSTK